MDMLYYIQYEDLKKWEKVQPFIKIKLWDVARKIQVVLKKNFNWKQSPFPFYKKTKKNYYIKNTKTVLK